jgi:proteasome lid subunit RPN8/RPN11
MIFFKAATTPAPLLEASAQLWSELLAHLRRQGGGVRESGAFLLGHKDAPTRVMTRFLPYEQLQADALHDDYVSLNAASFSKLWDLCRAERLSVVGDIHTHRYGPGQSQSDRTNPMVALAGHIALIVPRFAQGEVRVSDMNMYIYEGSHRWTSYSGSDVDDRLRLASYGGR